jgi:hypothetical protein
MGYYETATSVFTVDQDGIRIYPNDPYHAEHPPTSTSTVHLCYWCRQFESKADRDEDTWEGFNDIMAWDTGDIGGYIDYNGILGGQ